MRYNASRTPHPLTEYPGRPDAMSLNTSQDEVIAKRRERVAHYRLRRLSLRAIAEKIQGEGFASPAGKPWSAATIKTDVDAVREEWKASARDDMDQLIGEELALLNAVIPNALQAVEDGAMVVVGHEVEWGERNAVLIPKMERRENTDAIRTLAKLSESRRRLLALDKPQAVVGDDDAATSRDLLHTAAATFLGMQSGRAVEQVDTATLRAELARREAQGEAQGAES